MRTAEISGNSSKLLTVDIVLTSIRYFNVDKLVRFVCEISQPTEADHVNACVQNREKRQFRKQKDSRDSFVVDIRV
jgi:hypothetical protein